MKLIDPKDASARFETNQGIAIDVRSAAEFAAGHLPGALHMPAEHIDTDMLRRLAPLTPIFYCQSGMRTKELSERLGLPESTNVLCIEGGLTAWHGKGLPTIGTKTPNMPSLPRQVQMTVGMLLVIATALALTVSPYFVIAAGLIGVGLFFAGLTGTCTMAAILMHMPWNKAPKARADGFPAHG